jgi:MFS family permease
MMMRATGTGPFRLLMYGLILASAAAQFALVPIMPVYAHRLGLSGFQQGLVLGATGLASLAVSVPAGTLSDRFGARRITLAAGLLMAAAAFGQALAGSFPALLAARLTFGAGYGVVWTAGLVWLAAGAAGPRALGGSVASAGVGGVAGPAVSGALTQHFGLAVPLLATGAGFTLITMGLAALRRPPDPVAPRATGRPASIRAALRDRGVIGAAAAVITAGLSTGACSLLVPAQLHLAGASSGQIGLAFAAAGILFAAGSALTTAVGRRAVTLAVTCAGMLALTAALAVGVLSIAPVTLIVLLCVATAARSILWTVSYPLAADAAGRRGIGLGTAVGLLNGIWAATAVLGPMGAGLAAQHLGGRAAFGLTDAFCAAALTVTVAAAGRSRVRTRLRAWWPALLADRLAHQPAGRPADRLAARRTAGEGPDPVGHASGRAVP